jgi:hypothetical protein
MITKIRIKYLVCFVNEEVLESIDQKQRTDTETLYYTAWTERKRKVVFISYSINNTPSSLNRGLCPPNIGLLRGTA